MFTCPLLKVHAKGLVCDSDQIGKGEGGGDGGGQGDQDQEDGERGGCQTHLLPSWYRRTTSKHIACSLFEPRNISQHLMF